MAKYKVGDELIIVNDPTKDQQQLKSISNLTIEGDFATLNWGIKILDVQYDEPNVTLTYVFYSLNCSQNTTKNSSGQT